MLNATSNLTAVYNGINIRNTGAGDYVPVKCYIMWQYMYVYVLWLDMLPWPCEVHVCQKM